MSYFYFSYLQDYKIEIIKETELDEIFDFLRKHHFKADPLNKALDLCQSDDDPCVEFKEYYKLALNLNSSYKAMSGNEIVGVQINWAHGNKQKKKTKKLLFTTN